MKIALCQTDVAFRDPDKNYQAIEQAVIEAANSGADIVVLPEMWNTGYCLSELADFADPNGDRTKGFLIRLALQQKVTIIGGSVAISEEDHFSNIMYAVAKDGDLLASYRKVHPFQGMDEHTYIRPGNSANLFRIGDLACAGFICYDIRFPEWLRKHAANGAEVLFISAQWPSARITQWKQLLIARAIENQAFVVAVNRVGSDPANQFGGNSLVIHPSGEIIAEADDTPQNLLAEINLADVKKVREAMPVLADRRPELYF